MSTKRVAVFICMFVTAMCGVARADHPAVGFTTGIAGPAITIPAGGLPKGSGAVAVRLEYLNFGTIPDARLARLASEGVETHSVAYLLSPSLAAGYGFTDDLTVGLRLPYIIRSDIREGHVEEGEGAVHVHGDSDGVGDLVVLGQYRFIKGNAAGVETALLLGMKTPTGATGVRDRDGELFEVEHQPGSGSWDPLLGVAASKGVGRVSLDANILYAFATAGARRTNLGNRLQYNLAVSYRFGTERHHHHDDHEAPDHHDHEAPEHGHAAWDVILELNGEWQQKQKIAGVLDENSGGSVLYISPAARFCGAGSWSATVSFGVPVVQELNGVQHETDFRTVFVVGKGF